MNCRFKKTTAAIFALMLAVSFVGFMYLSHAQPTTKEKPKVTEDKKIIPLIPLVPATTIEEEETDDNSDQKSCWDSDILYESDFIKLKFTKSTNKNSDKYMQIETGKKIDNSMKEAVMKNLKDNNGDLRLHLHGDLVVDSDAVGAIFQMKGDIRIISGRTEFVIDNNDLLSIRKYIVRTGMDSESGNLRLSINQISDYVFYLKLEFADSVIPFKIRVLQEIEPEYDSGYIVAYRPVPADKKMEFLRGNYCGSQKSLNLYIQSGTNVSIGFKEIPLCNLSDEWYADAVKYTASRGAVPTDKGIFNPIAEVSRQTFVQSLVRAFGLMDSKVISDGLSGGNEFEDTDDPYVTLARSLGIVSGVSENKFGPDIKLSREQMYTMLHTALDRLGELPKVQKTTGMAGFKDQADVSAWARKPISRMIDLKLLKGNDDEIMPKRIVTLSEVAVILYRLTSEK